jgi:medium-chain acyl-[acyl-carrier-protein] hydrolase
MQKTEKFVVRKRLATSEVGMSGLLRPVSMMQELQAIADAHATILGAGRTFCLNSNISWVVTHYAVDIAELPDDREELSFITWPSNHEALKAVRDFEIRGADNRVMIRATSRWIMIDLATRRPVRLADFLPEWDCIPARALDVPFDKLPDFEAGDVVDFPIRFDDIDVNRHVNNAVYAIWATESLGSEFLDAHKLRGLKLNFKKEIPFGTAGVSVGVSIDRGRTAAARDAGANAINANIADASVVATRHVISADGITRAVAACEWEE